MVHYILTLLNLVGIQDFITKLSQITLLGKKQKKQKNSSLKLLIQQTPTKVITTKKEIIGKVFTVKEPMLEAKYKH